jgi:hypothetical protein
VTGLAHELPDTNRLSFERTAGPSLPNTFGTARPHKSLPSPEWPITALPAPPNRPLTNIGASIGTLALGWVASIGPEGQAGWRQPLPDEDQR